MEPITYVVDLDTGVGVQDIAGHVELLGAWLVDLQERTRQREALEMCLDIWKHGLSVSVDD